MSSHLHPFGSYGDKYFVFRLLIRALSTELLRLKLLKLLNVKSEKSNVSEKDRKTFGIHDGTLKRASKIFMGKQCGDIYQKPPTTWGDVYTKFGWDKVRRTVKPIEAKVIGINSKPVAFGNTEYVNYHDKVNVTYNTSVIHKVEETVSHFWSRGEKQE